LDVGEQGGAGVELEQGGSAQGVVVGESAALDSGVEGLPGNAQGSGAAGTATVAANQLVNQGVVHDRLREARRRVVVYGGLVGTRCQMKITRVGQFVVAKSRAGQSVFFMPLARG
jgi:hypothetical protein